MNSGYKWLDQWHIMNGCSFMQYIPAIIFDRNVQRIKKAFLQLLTIALTFNFLFAQQPVKETIYFEYDKYDLTESANAILNKSCEKIIDKELHQITLIGHTDSDGSDKYNLTLSENRTKTILNYFLSKGISKGKIKIQFYGENKPIAQNDNEHGKQQNRRVEIIIEQKEFIVSDIFLKFNKPSQLFKVSGNEVIEITSKEGTMIKIPANSLVNKNGQTIIGKVEIELKEFYTKSDIILANLHTTSNKDLLETAGMIDITANHKGEKLKLNIGKEMEIEFSSKNQVDGMQIFIGENRNNKFNWVQQNADTSTISENVFSEVNIDTSENEKINTLNKIIFKTTNFGLINCDWFYKSQNTTDLFVDIDTTYRPEVRLVFKDINAIMSRNYLDENKIIFNKVPIGQKATLIAFSLVNDEPYYASKDIHVRENGHETIKLIKTTLLSIEKELIKLN